MAFVELFLLFFGAHGRRQLARQQTSVAPWIYFEHV
jgi:hypothetical protein